MLEVASQRIPRAGRTPNMPRLAGNPVSSGEFVSRGVTPTEIYGFLLSGGWVLSGSISEDESTDKRDESG